MRQRGRRNPRSAFDCPPGFFMCPHGGCQLLLPDRVLAQEAFSCPRGHAYSPTELERLAYEPGGWTHVGISCTEQGAIGEDVVRALGSLGEYGRIEYWAQRYHEALDGRTARWGIEVKTLSTRAKNLHYVPGTRRMKDRKDAAARECGLEGVLAVLVVLDYPRSKAQVYLRPMRHIHYCEVNTMALFTTVKFESPFE